MKKSTIELIGLTFLVAGVPETSAEFNARVLELTGETEDTCVVEAISNKDYRTYYPRVRAELSKHIASLGFARAAKTSKGKSGKEITTYTETETVHIKRAVGEGIVTQADLKTIGQAWIDANPWDTVCLGTAGRTASLPKDIERKAQEMLDAGDTDFDAVEAKIAGFIPGFVLDRDGENEAPTLETLGRALVAFRKAVTAF